MQTKNEATGQGISGRREKGLWSEFKNNRTREGVEHAMRIGIVGCGVALAHHIGGIRDVPGVEIVGVCDLDLSKAKNACKKFGIRRGYPDFESLVTNEKPHVVHILTPPDTHAVVAIAAMDKGCHVLIEKPMAVSLDEVDSMIVSERENGVHLCVMHNHLFDPQIVKAQEMVRKGTIGDLLHVNVTYCLDTRKMRDERLIASDHWAHRLPLRIFGEYTPHMIYLLLSMLGKVQSVKVSPRNIDNPLPQAVDGLNVMLISDSCTGHLSMLTNTTYGHFTVHLYGSKAVVHINMLDLTMTMEKEYPFPRPMGNMLATVAQSLTNLSTTTTNAAKIATGRLKRRPGHRLLIQRFYDNLREGNAPPVPSEQGREVVKILQMIKDHWSIGPATHGPS